MGEIYDLQKHTHCVYILIDEKEIFFDLHNNITRRKVEEKSYDAHKTPTRIVYNKRKTKVLSKGYDPFFSPTEYCIQYDDFLNGLYYLFKKGKKNWDEDDRFFIKAISEFLYQKTRSLVDHSTKIPFKSLHYVFFIPSEWETEIQEVLLRPIFIQANLISEDDHKDRLLFINEIEGIWYDLSGSSKYDIPFKRGQNTILCRHNLIDGDTILIKIDLVNTVNTLFGFNNSTFFPKIIRSDSLIITVNTIKCGIKTYLRDNFFANIKVIEETKKSFELMTEYIYNNGGYDLWMDLEKKIDIGIHKREGLTDSQVLYLGSLRPIDILPTINTNCFSKLKDILANDLVKNYEFLAVGTEDIPVKKTNKAMVDWTKLILKHFHNSLFFTGCSKLVNETIKYSNMYCTPRMLSKKKLAASPSIFIDSKPDIIIDIDLSLDLTLLTYSHLNSDGFVMKIFDHDYFTIDQSLPTLKAFYSFLQTTALNVKEKFIFLAEKYSLCDSTRSLYIDESFIFQVEAILNEKQTEKQTKILVQQPKYLKAFLLMYIVYIRVIIWKRWPAHLKPENTRLKIGYEVTIEKILLDNIIGSKEELRELIYASGLIHINDKFKKLRVVTKGEGITSIIQRFFEIEFPMKSYFVLAQLHENYIQLTLNQIVTTSTLDNKSQEAIIIEDKIINVQNIYVSLGLKMWDNLINNDSFVELCGIHSQLDSVNDRLSLFSLKTKKEFMDNFRQYISNNILNTNSDLKQSHKNLIDMNHSCTCKVSLTIIDIIEVSFKPALEEMVSILLASLINDDIFGKYVNIKHQFSLIHFNQNLQFQNILSTILEDKIDNLKPEQGIDTLCIVLPELSTRIFQPVLRTQSLSYTGFRIGTLHQIFIENYALEIRKDGRSGILVYRSHDDDIGVMNDRFFTPFKRGDIINYAGITKTYYLLSIHERVDINFNFYKYKTFGGLNKAGAINRKNKSWTLLHSPKWKYIKLDDGRNYIFPIMVTFKFLGYNSTIQISFKKVGELPENTNIIEIGYPMTLRRL